MEYYDDSISYNTICCDNCGMENYHHAKNYNSLYFCNDTCIIEMLEDISAIRDIYVRVEEDLI